MSLLWARAMRRIAMPWFQHPDEPPRTPVHVTKAGFAGHVGADDDQDFIDFHQPEPTHEEMHHLIEHGDYPQSFHDRHQQAVQKAWQERSPEDIPDMEDGRLHHYLRYHWSDPEIWKRHGNLGPVDIHQPVYATQSHVAQEHIDKYMKNPGAAVNDAENRTSLDSGHPMLVTHEGRLHAIEGHHRIAAALQRGDHKIDAWHLNLDHMYMPDYDGHQGAKRYPTSENVERLLKYRPSDGASWQEVHDGYDWGHPSMRAMVADVAQNGVREPVRVDYEQHPPQITDGHTRVLAAHKAGVDRVPVRHGSSWDLKMEGFE